MIIPTVEIVRIVEIVEIVEFLVEIVVVVQSGVVEARSLFVIVQSIGVKLQNTQTELETEIGAETNLLW